MKKRTLDVLRAAVAAVLLGVSFFLDGLPLLLVSLAAFAVAGEDVVRKAVKGVLRGRFSDENFLMSVAAIGAFAIGEYREAAAVTVFYRVGEIFENYAVNRSRKAVEDLAALCPDSARLVRDGKTVEVDPAEAEIGETLVVYPGERFALDGVVVEGETFVDTSSLTGESVPRRAAVGDEVLSGSVNVSRSVTLRIVRTFEKSAASRILELVENAANRKAKSESFIARFAKYYTPAVMALAALIAVLPPLCGLGAWGEWIRRALMCLVVSCPCALVVSVPLTFFCGIGRASKAGVLVKGSDALETASRVDCVLFDKTGTLTKGVFRVVECLPEGVSEEVLLRTAALAESMSDHPIASALRNAYKGDITSETVTSCETVAGKGVKTTVNGAVIVAGNRDFLLENGISVPVVEGGTVVYAASDGVFLGTIRLDDEVRDNAKEAIADLRRSGVVYTAMLTGDRAEPARKIADALGLDEIRAELLPENKVDEAMRFCGRKNKTLYVGDGLNDAPVLVTADLGMAMGAVGSDAAIDAADAVMTDSDLSKIPFFVRLSRFTVGVARENIVFALAVKAAVLIGSTVGVCGMWAAVFADVGVTVLAVLNALRVMRFKR